jgi:hypothetical protein
MRFGLLEEREIETEREKEERDRERERETERDSIVFCSQVTPLLRFRSSSALVNNSPSEEAVFKSLAQRFHSQRDESLLVRIERRGGRGHHKHRAIEAE